MLVIFEKHFNAPLNDALSVGLFDLRVRTEGYNKYNIIS